MNNFDTNNYQNIIKGLESLNSVKAPDSLKNRLKMLLSGLSSEKKYVYNPFLKLRPLLLALIILLFTGSSLVLASLNSRPGDLLYPVKTKVNSLFFKKEDSYVPPLSPSPTLSPTPAVSDRSEEPEDSGVPSQPKDDIEIPGIPDVEEIIPTKIPVNNILTIPTSVLEVDNQLLTPDSTGLPVEIKLNFAGLKIGL